MFWLHGMKLSKNWKEKITCMTSAWETPSSFVLRKRSNADNLPGLRLGMLSKQKIHRLRGLRFANKFEITSFVPNFFGNMSANKVVLFDIEVTRYFYRLKLGKLELLTYIPFVWSGIPLASCIFFPMILWTMQNSEMLPLLIFTAVTFP